MSIEGRFLNSTLSVPFVQAARPIEQAGGQSAWTQDAWTQDLAVIVFISLIGLVAAFVLIRAFPMSPWIATSIAQLS